MLGVFFKLSDVLRLQLNVLNYIMLTTAAYHGWLDFLDAVLVHTFAHHFPKLCPLQSLLMHTKGLPLVFRNYVNFAAVC